MSARTGGLQGHCLCCEPVICGQERVEWDNHAMSLGNDCGRLWQTSRMSFGELGRGLVGSSRFVGEPWRASERRSRPVSEVSNHAEFRTTGSAAGGQVTRAHQSGTGAERRAVLLASPLSQTLSNWQRSSVVRHGRTEAAMEALCHAVAHQVPDK